MNKTGSTLGMALALALTAPPMMAEELVRLNFSGTLIVPPCLLTVENPEQGIDFAQLSKRDLLAAGESAPRGFDITVSTCATARKIDLLFKGQEEPLLSGALAINGSASGLAIVLETAAGSPIKLNGDKLSYIISGGPHEQLLFKAYLVRLKNRPLVDGTFTAVANFELTYP